MAFDPSISRTEYDSAYAEPEPNIPQFDRRREVLVWAVETLGELACARAVLSGHTWEEAQDEVMQRPVVLQDGRELHWRIYRDDPATEQSQTLTRKIVDGRAARYTRDGVWREDAEKTDDMIGPDIEIIALVGIDPDTSEETPVASVRLIHRPIAELPTFQHAVEAGALSEEGLTKLYESLRGRTAVELGALWKNRKMPHSVTMALYRMAFHMSYIRKEGWVYGGVPKEAAILEALFGTDVVHRLGDPFEVRDGNAADGLMLTPEYIDPPKVFEGFAISAERSRREGDEAKYRHYMGMLWYFANGLDPAHYDKGTQDLFERLMHEEREMVA